MVMFALVAFWDYLVIYASGHRFNGPMASAWGKSLYSLMCDGSPTNIQRRIQDSTNR